MSYWAAKRRLWCFSELFRDLQEWNGQGSCPQATKMVQSYGCQTRWETASKSLGSSKPLENSFNFMNKILDISFVSQIQTDKSMGDLPSSVYLSISAWHTFQWAKAGAFFRRSCRWLGLWFSLLTFWDLSLDLMLGYYQGAICKTNRFRRSSKLDLGCTGQLTPVGQLFPLKQPRRQQTQIPWYFLSRKPEPIFKSWKPPRGCFEIRNFHFLWCWQWNKQWEKASNEKENLCELNCLLHEHWAGNRYLLIECQLHPME